VFPGWRLAIGPLVGGLLTEHVNWNWIFFINVRSGSSACSRSALHRRVARHVTGAAPRPAGPDHLGRRLFSLTYAFIRANNYRLGLGPDPRCVRLAAVMLVAFVLLERHQRRRCSSWRCSEPTFSGANGSMLFVRLAMFGRSSTSRCTCRTSSTARRSDGRELPADDALIILIAPRRHRSPTDRLALAGRVRR
jgi:MFS family permease